MSHLFRTTPIAARIAVLAALITGCAGLNPIGPTARIHNLPAGGHHVLFIGNSLTYTNDLPGTVAAMARSAGDTVRVMSVALPNLAVIDHALGHSNAVAAISSQSWEYVILQQGPTTVGLNRDTLIIATKLLDPYVRAAGGRIAQFMAWPRSDRSDLFDAVRQTSQVAAESVNGMFIPAGEAWNAALTATPGLALYGPDGYHPDPLGTYLAALVIFERVTGRDARNLPATAMVAGVPLIVSENTVQLLQQIAHETVARFPESQPITSTAVGR